MRKLAFIALALLSACGPPLVQESFLGTPVFELGGTVAQANLRIPGDHGEVHLSLLWIGVGADAAAPPVEQRTELDSALGAYSMTLFEAPPVEATTFSDLVPPGRLGLAVLALYADVDGDGLLDLERDVLLGAGRQHLLAWSSAAIPADAPGARLVGALGPGYQLLEQDVPGECPFVATASCAPEGLLTPAPATDPVILTLWPDAEQVLVPAPRVDADAPEGPSIWSR